MSKHSFSEKVKQIVRSIPIGKTLSYKEVAERAGSPHAYRAVARIMAKNYDRDIPCHRVIHSSGKIGDYNRGGEVIKTLLLTQEHLYVGRKKKT